MRHLGSLLLSLVLTALWYLVLGFGYSRYLFHGHGKIENKLLLGSAILVAGAIYGLLLLLRLSPVGLVPVGLALLALGMWTLFGAPDNTPFDHLPKSVFGQRGVLSIPIDYATFAGVPMVLTVFSPRRWRRYANPRPAANAYSPTPPVPLTPPPGGYPPPAFGGAPTPPPPFGGVPVDPFASPVEPVSPGGSGPDGTRVMPGPASPVSGGGYPAAGSGYSSPSYPAPLTPSYPPPAPASPGYSYPPSSTPSSAPPAPPANSPSPLWPSGPGSTQRDDPDATRPI
jgi:hypothetical protein